MMIVCNSSVITKMFYVFRYAKRKNFLPLPTIETSIQVYKTIGA